MSRVILVLVAMVACIWGVIAYVRAERAYDPVQVCEKQTDPERCLRQVRDVRSASGW